MNKEKAVKPYEDIVSSYETIAREAGYYLCGLAVQDAYFWENSERVSMYNYSTQEEAWKACCVDNGLIGE